MLAAAPCATGQKHGDQATTNQCLSCVLPAQGCDCPADAEPESCFLKDQFLADGTVMCSEGTRFCRGGTWSDCEGVQSYIVTPDPNLASLVDPNAVGQAIAMLCLPISRDINGAALTIDGGTSA